MLGSINESNLFEKCLGECQSKVRADKLANTASGGCGKVSVSVQLKLT